MLSTIGTDIVLHLRVHTSNLVFTIISIALCQLELGQETVKHLQYTDCGQDVCNDWLNQLVQWQGVVPPNIWLGILQFLQSFLH